VSIINDLLIRIWTSLHRGERGQDTAEYIVMTAVVVAIIAAVVYVAYSGALQTAVEALGTAITDALP